MLELPALFCRLLGGARATFEEEFAAPAPGKEFAIGSVGRATHLPAGSVSERIVHDLCPFPSFGSRIPDTGDVWAMVQLILFIIGIIYLVRRPRLTRLRPEHFPGVPKDEFLRWKGLELASMDTFLWTVFGVSLGGCVLSALLRAAVQEAVDELAEVILVQALYASVFLVGLIGSAIYGSKAAKLRRSLGIPWPRAKKRAQDRPAGLDAQGRLEIDSRAVICQNCGTENSNVSPRCSFCGEKL